MDELASYIDRWGQFATPEPGSQLIQFGQYMAWTPEECNKLELVDGEVFVGNSAAGTRRMLAFFMRAVGLTTTLRLAPVEAWQPALESIGVPITADMEWKPLSEPVRPSVNDAPLSRRQAANELAMQVHLQAGINVSSGHWYVGPLAVRSSPEYETVLLPDHMYLAPERDACQREYYLAGAPDWILDSPWPGSLSFWREVKLPRYMQGGAQEVWLLDWQRRHVDVFTVSNERPVRAGRYGPDDRIRSEYFPDLMLDPTASFRRAGGLERGTENSSERSEQRMSRRASPQPEPPRRDVDRLSAWRPAAWHKVEIVDGTVYVAGTQEETYRALALLVANCGLTAAADLAPPAHWRAALDRL